MFGGVGFGDQPFKRNIEVFGVGDVGVFVRGSPFHRFCDGTDIIDAVVPHGVEVKAFENVEHFENHRSPSGWMVRRDVETAVGAADGIVVGGPVLRKVHIVHQSAMGGNIFGDSLRQLAYVEDVRTLGRDKPQGVGEVIIDDHVTDSLGEPIRPKIDLAARCGIAESFGVVRSTH